jgi:hypothetical protein
VCRRFGGEGKAGVRVSQRRARLASALKVNTSITKSTFSEIISVTRVHQRLPTRSK